MNKLNIAKNNNQPFDAVIIGSDEVWNLKGYFEHVREFFGENLNAEKIIAYAPSLGFCSVNFFLSAPEAQKLKDFYALFPRDSVTQTACQNISGKLCSLVCDPTILMYDSWDRHIKGGTNIHGPYIVYYSYLNDTPMKVHIKRYAKEKGLRLIISNFNYSWGDSIEIPSPLQFLNLIKNAECVFTSTFHGSVFSTIFKKQVVIRPSGQKVIDYISNLGLDSQIYNDTCTYEEFVRQVNNPINYEAVHGKLSNMKEHSLELLSDVL